MGTPQDPRQMLLDLMREKPDLLLERAAEAVGLSTENAARILVNAPMRDGGVRPDPVGYPDDNPKTQYGEQKPKLSSTPTAPLQALGAVMESGAAKYGRFNWREKTVSSTVYYDAALRHLMAWFDGEDTDPESGQPHLAHVMACVCILLDASAHGRLNDNR